jgi:hypothetical protein
MAPSRIPCSTPQPKRRDGTEQLTRSAKLNLDLAECLDTTFFLFLPQVSESGSVHHSEESSSIYVPSNIRLTSFPDTAIGVMSSDLESGVMKIEHKDLSNVSATSNASIENSDVNDGKNGEQEFSNLKHYVSGAWTQLSSVDLRIYIQPTRIERQARTDRKLFRSERYPKYK